MAKSKIILLKIKKNQDGTHPVVLRLSQGSIRNYIFLNYSCTSDKWNEDLSRFNSDYRKYKQHNSILEKKEELAEEIMDYFEKRNLEFSVDLFKRKFQPKHPDNLTVFGLFEAITSDLKDNNKLGNAAIYKDAKNALKRFYSGPRLMFQDLDKPFLTKYKNWLKNQKNKQGDPLSDRSVSVYLRTLRAVYYKAIDEGLVSEELNPFGKGKFSVNNGLNLKTRKRAIQKSEVLKIFAYNGDLRDAKNLFIFSYLTGGMNFTDMAYLKWKNIRASRIEYKRRKTGTEFSIKITEIIQNILGQYKGREYIFPILLEHHKTEAQKRERIKTANKKFNSELRSLGNDIGIETHLSSYVARHSMATILYKEEKQSVSDIQEFMGHSEERITQTYLDSIDQSEKDKLQDKLL